MLLGIIGGIGLLIGPAGLFMLAQKRDPILADSRATAWTPPFIAMLFLVSLTGLR